MAPPNAKVLKIKHGDADGERELLIQVGASTDLETIKYRVEPELAVYLPCFEAPLSPKGWRKLPDDNGGVLGALWRYHSGKYVAAEWRGAAKKSRGIRELTALLT